MKAPGHPLLIGRLLISSRTRAGFARQARQTLDEEKSMKRLILTGALSACALMVAACDQRADEAAEADVTAAEADGAEAGDTSTAAGGSGGTTASADWPKGTRIIEEGGRTYRVDPDGTRVVIDNNEWRIVTEDGERFRVNDAGTRIRIDDDGLDVDVPIDVDLGTNKKGNLDLDVSTDGTDAKN